MRLKFSDLFHGVGTDTLRYSERCTALSGTEVELLGFIAKDHPESGRAMLVDQPGVCPDCSPAPVAALELPGFAATGADTAVRLRGRLSYGFVQDAAGNASMLRLENARIATGLPA
jgi:hypothetical protein